MYVPKKKHVKAGLTQDYYYRIDSGRYKGVEFVYGDIRIETKKDAEATVTFDFDILYSPLKRVKPEPFFEVLKEILNIELLKISEEETTPLQMIDHTEEFSRGEILS